MTKAHSFLSLLAFIVGGVFLASCVPTVTPSEKTQLLEAAESLTDAAFTAGAPVLTEAASALPIEAQALIQAGYAALKKAVEVAEAKGVDHAGAQATLNTVAQTADTLHNVVHNTGAVATP